MQTKSEVWITTQFEGFHRWPEAPDEVSYLRNLHRHLFKVKVTVPTSSDRQIEFHLLKKWVNESLNNCPITDRTEDSVWSCESIAEVLATGVIHEWNVEWCEATISEDGECGATVLVERTI